MRKQHTHDQWPDGDGSWPDGEAIDGGTALIRPIGEKARLAKDW